MKTIHLFLLAIGIMMVLVPTAVHAQETDARATDLAITPPTVLNGRLSVDSLASEQAVGVPSVVVRRNWTKADALLGSRRGHPTETVRLTKDEKARFPIANYALRAVAAQACVQRVPNGQTARCFSSTVNGTPVTRYPGIITDEPLQHPDPFVQRPGRHTP